MNTQSQMFFFFFFVMYYERRVYSRHQFCFCKKINASNIKTSLWLYLTDVKLITRDRDYSKISSYKAFHEGFYNTSIAITILTKKEMMLSKPHQYCVLNKIG